jgi:hypothetical protein
VPAPCGGNPARPAGVQAKAVAARPPTRPAAAVPVLQRQVVNNGGLTGGQFAALQNAAAGNANANVSGLWNTPHYTVTINAGAGLGNHGQTVVSWGEHGGHVGATIGMAVGLDDLQALETVSHEIGVHIAPYHPLLDARAQGRAPSAAMVQKQHAERNRGDGGGTQHVAARDATNPEFSALMEAITANANVADRRPLVDMFVDNLARYDNRGQVMNRGKRAFASNQRAMRQNHPWIKGYETNREYLYREAEAWAPTVVFGALALASAYAYFTSQATTG